MWKGVANRELGRSTPLSFANQVRASRISSLELSNDKEVVSPHKGGVNTLQVDLTEHRYLLSGASDGSAAVFDIQQASCYEGSSIAKHKPLFVVDKHLQCGHKYSISSAIWYPVDSGMFITGSHDHYVKVWDTNTRQVAMHFKMPGKVYGIAMSTAATSHMLIASGTEDVQVRLCDISSGAFTHTLSGHRAGVSSVQWSSSCEWILVTGGCDGAIRFWDIRRAGCFRVLDQFQTQSGRRPPTSVHTSSKVISSDISPPFHNYRGLRIGECNFMSDLKCTYIWRHPVINNTYIKNMFVAPILIIVQVEAMCVKISNLFFSMAELGSR